MGGSIVECPVDRDLERRVGVVVGAADHVRDPMSRSSTTTATLNSALPSLRRMIMSPISRRVLTARSEDPVVPAEIGVVFGMRSRTVCGPQSSPRSRSRQRPS